MSSPVKDITALIGNTPILALSRFGENFGARVFAKIESSNPGSSVKDRIALAMIEAAEKDGSLKPGAVIVEPTSGNTGIGLAMVGRIRGYRVILTMPESMSVERRRMLRSLGAELVLTEARSGMRGAIAEAECICAETHGAFMPRQFDNPANPAAHFATTGPEIAAALSDGVDILVAGVGTGGTLTGAGRFLRTRNPALQIIAVEPEESPVISGGTAGPHMIQGIGAGFVPKNLDTSIVSETVTISSRLAVETARALGKVECLMVGISSGAAAAAAGLVALRPENKGRTIVTIFPDTSERYVSTLLFHED